MSKVFKSFAAVLLILSMICGLVACNAAPSQKSFVKAYTNEVSALTGAISSYYDKIDDYDMNDINLDLAYSVQLSDDLLSLLRSLTSYDLEWINNLKLNLSENFKDEMMSFILGITYDKTELATAEVIMNLADNEVFMNIPVISETFAVMDLSEVYDANTLGVMQNLNMKDLLPSEEPLKDLVEEVSAVIIEGISDVTFEEAELTANGVTQACVAYTAELSEKEIAVLCLNVLETLEKSENFKTVICDFVKAYSDLADSMDLEEIDYTPDEAYDELITEITAAITDLKDSIDGGQMAEEALFTLTSYITGKLDVIGIKIDIPDSAATCFFAATQNKGQFGIEAYYESDGEKYAALEGDLTIDGKDLSGTYEVKVNGESMLFIDLDNVDAKKLMDGYFIGSVSISPSKGLIELIADAFSLDSSMAGLSLANLAIKFDYIRNDGKEAEIAISLMNGDKPYISILMDGKTTNGTTVEKPQNAIDDIEEWAKGIHLDEFISRVETSGLPDYVVEYAKMLEDLLQ